MSKKPRLLFHPASFVLVGFMVVAFLSFVNVAPFNGNSFADCAENVTFDRTLPLSHPINRCASQTSKGVSWSSWFTGHSSSYQFHFIDLLELLSRNNDTPKKATP